MKNEISFTVPGVPVPWARASGGKTTKHFTPAKQRAYMNAVRLIGKAAMKGKKPLTGPLKIDVVAVYPPPKNQPPFGWKSTRADGDNIFKLAADSLNKITYEDDAQLCDIHIAKMYGTKPELTIKISRLDQ